MVLSDDIKVKLGFTGHRDRLAKLFQLESLLNDYPSSIWIHGGAIGFDSQVDTFATEHGIEVVKHVPMYSQYPAHIAPLVRNRLIVDQCDILVALYDGRKHGGTYYTVNYAKEHNVRIIMLDVYQ